MDLTHWIITISATLIFKFDIDSIVEVNFFISLYHWTTQVKNLFLISSSCYWMLHRTKSLFFSFPLHRKEKYLSLISESDIVLLLHRWNREEMREKGVLVYHYLIFNLGTGKNRESVDNSGFQWLHYFSFLSDRKPA